MIFVDELKKAIDVMLLKNNDAKSMSVGGSLAFYYKASLIPLILNVILTVIMFVALGSVSGGLLGSAGSLLGGAIGILAVVVIIFAYWIVIPLGLLIDAAIYYVIGRLIGVYKQGYDAAFNGVVYGVMPYIVLSFLAVIPLLGGIIGVIAGLWALVALVYWLSKMQKTSYVSTIVVLVIVLILIVILLLIIGASFLSLLHL